VMNIRDRPSSFYRAHQLQLRILKVYYWGYLSTKMESSQFHQLTKRAFATWLVHCNAFCRNYW